MGASLRPFAKLLPMHALTLLLLEIQAEVPGLLLRFPESEAMHRFRVRIKQLRSLERLRQRDSAWRSISAVYGAAGALRDLEHRLRFAGTAFGTSHLIYRNLLQTRPELLQRLNQALREFNRRVFIAAVQALEKDLSTMDDAANKVWVQCRDWLRKARLRLRKTRQKAMALHDARKALKQSVHLLQCFYTAETLQPLRDLEQDIGRWHDEWDWCRHAADMMGRSAKSAFPGQQAALQNERRLLRERVLGFRLRQLR